jgi:hypothetical protein
VAEPALSDSRMGVSPAEFWNAADTAATTGVALQPGSLDSDQTSTSSIENPTSCCSTVRHFGTHSGLKKTAAVCEKRAILLALWLF